MGTPEGHLPGPLSDDSINEFLISLGLPKAASVVAPKVTAAFHTIYRITVPENSISPHSDLILRVAGHHLPRIKTENEVGVMTWVLENTSIPIPDLVAYDVTTANPLGYEYTLLSRIPGVTLSDVYPSLSDAQVEPILDQLIDILSQLHQHEWNEIGGLRRTDQGTISVGQIVDETFWFGPDVQKSWPPGETVTSLNIQGPYSSYIESISASVRKYIELIIIHEGLSFLRSTIPRLEAFLSVLPSHSAELNRVKLVLAHKDLHFANMLYDVESGRLTAILDWEFAGVVPMTKWNPRRAFLWNAQEDGNGAESKRDKQRLMDLFTARCEERGVFPLEGANYSSELQDSMQKVVDFLRAITEVVPRGQRLDLVSDWHKEVLDTLSIFGA